MPKVWAEVWDRLGDPSFGRKIADLPALRGSYTSRSNGVGDGQITLPRGYERLDDILKPDSASPGNAEWSLIRFFTETQAAPIAEWLPAQVVPEQDKNDPDLEVQGPGIDALWGFARVEAWDWNGSDFHISTFPDWIYGGRNLLRNPGFEDSSPQNETYEMFTVATGGTYTLTVLGQTTGNLAFNISASSLETALEGLSTVNACLVTGAGSEADPWVIEFVDPFILSTDMTVNGSLLTGGTTPRITLTKTQEGQLEPDGWTKSQRVDRGVTQPFGDYDQFRVTSAQAHTGTYSLEIDPATVGRPYAGAQQIVKVKPGGIYQASIWVRTPDNTTLFRLVIRGAEGETFIASSTPFSGQTLTANTWTQLTITDVVIPDGVTTIIFRIANVDQSGNPGTFFIDDAIFAEGMAAATPGFILRELYEDATVDHAPGRVIWSNGAGVYLTLDFTDSLDSAGVAWAASHSMTLKRGQSYLRVLSEFWRLGYESRIVPDDWEAGTWKLQVYNTGGMGTDYTAITTGPSIQGGRDTTRRDLRRFLPQYNDVAVEAGSQAITRSRSTTSISALGRIESYIPSQDLTAEPTATRAANTAITERLSESQTLAYTLVPGDGPEWPEPFVSYNTADTLYVLDPPDVPTREARRIMSLGVTFTKSTVEYPVQLESESFVGVGGLWEGLHRLLDAFSPIREEPKDVTVDLFGGGGGAPTIVIAASDATDLSKSKADVVCSGINDHDAINAAIASLGDKGGRVLLTEGTFWVDTDALLLRQVINGDISLQGMNWTETIIRSTGTSGTIISIGSAGDNLISDLTVWGNFGTTVGIGAGIGSGSSLVQIHRVLFFNCFTGVRLGGDQWWINNCFQQSGTWFVRDLDLFTRTKISNCEGGMIDMGDGTDWKIWGCYLTGQIVADLAERFTISDITFDGAMAVNTIDAHIAIGAGEEGIISRCYMPAGRDGVLLDGTRNVIIEGCNGNFNDVGIWLDGANQCVVANNRFKWCAEHGIRVTAGKANQIIGNHLLDPGNGTTNTFDGIFLEGDSDRNYMVANRVEANEPGFGGSPRYGINVSAATCNDNIYVANWCGPTAGFATATYNDAGTGTLNVWPGAAAPQGDNFVL